MGMSMCSSLFRLGVLPGSGAWETCNLRGAYDTREVLISSSANFSAVASPKPGCERSGLSRQASQAAYAPQQGRPNEEKIAFYDKLQDTLDSLPVTSDIILLGDLNGHVGREVVENVTGHFGIQEETIGVTKPGQSKKKKTAWWTEEMAEAVKLKSTAFKYWLKVRTSAARVDYECKRKAANQLKRRLKKEQWVRIGEDLKADFKCGRKLLYGMAKSYRNGRSQETSPNVLDKDGNILRDKDKIDSRWQEHFQELLNVVGDMNHDPLTTNHETPVVDNTETHEPDITMEELDAALKSMKNNRAPGPDFLCIETIKAGEKAFDRVPRNKMWEVMSQAQIPPKLLSAIKSTYVEQKSAVRGSENYFSINTGILEDVMTKWDDGLNEKGLKLSYDKTEYMAVGKDLVTRDLDVNGHAIKPVDTFTYLGSTVNNAATIDTEINNRIAKFSKNTGALYPLLRDRNIPTDVRVHIYTSILKPILTYGCETWTLTERRRSILQAAEMRVLRLIYGVTKRDHIRNTTIRASLKVEPIINYVEKSQLRWFGHVKRMAATRGVKRILEWKPPGKRPLGRPRMRWTDGLKKILAKRTNISFEEAEKLCGNRTAWRSLIGTLN
ncbi:hypothetical protein Bbelb_374170 [Branchiostoma belcheri]|nr:hypothetical protein Bbelb_374170 [Branchiostoma belcheri]